MSLAVRLGFDPARLRFATPTAVAACVALAVSAGLGLEHPQWSGMTVWAASQPSRGQLLEKSFFRFAGTVSGTLAGVTLVWVSADRPWLLVAGLAAWIGACAAIGNLQRGFVSYGTMLAGYSAAMVSLLDTGHPDRVFELGLDRLATVLVGVVVALVVGVMFAGPGAEDRIVARADAAVARLLRHLAARTSLPRDQRAAAAARALSQIAEIDDGLDPHGAGSLRSRRVVRRVRSRLIAQVSGLLWLHGPTFSPLPEDLAGALEAIADRLDAGAEGHDLAPLLDEALRLAEGRPRLTEVLTPLFAALSTGRTADDGAPAPAPGGPTVVLHRDWVGAWQAMVRSAATLGMVGALWILSGWSAGPFLLLGTAIMTSLFSTFDNPAQFMRNVFAGQILGALGALACRWLVWPAVDGEIARVATLMPFILLGIGVFAHRRTQLAGFDYNMVVLLLSQPVGTPTGTFPQSLMLAAAVAAAPLAGWLAYRLVYPLEPRHRLERLVAAMVHDLAAMARPGRGGLDRTVWRGRLYHRLLRAIRWAEKTGVRSLPISEGALAVLDLGSAVLRLREIRGEPDLDRSTARAIDHALARVPGLAAAPERLARALGTTAVRLTRAGRAEDAARLVAVGEAVLANRAFFALAEAGGRDGTRTARLAVEVSP